MKQLNVLSNLFKLHCLLYLFVIKFLIKDMEVRNQLLNKLSQAQQLINIKEYFNAKLAVDNLKHIYNINKITDVVLVKELQVLEKLTKQL